MRIPAFFGHSDPTVQAPVIPKERLTKTVLFIEDNRETSFVHQSALKHTEYRTIFAANLPEARLVMDQITPALIVLDRFMDQKDSLHYIDELRSQDYTGPESRSAGHPDGGAGSVMAKVDSILLVDDRPADRYAIAHALKRAGYAVIEAQTGTEALHLARQTPSAVILSVKLPDIIGYEVCRRLKANPRTGHIPVPQLSSVFADNESRVYALDSGADAYLTQPVDPHVLIATVRSLVKLHEAESIARLSARQWQATFDALSEGVAVLGADNKIEHCNRAMSALLDRPYAEIEGRDPADLLGGRLSITRTADGRMGVQEINLGERYLRVRIEPVTQDGAAIGGIFILADVTFEKLTERATLLNERLVATGHIAHAIAHEINNPLEAITNLLYLLRSQQTNASDTAQYLSMAESELSCVSRISKQILTFHRESATQVPVNLSSLMDDVFILNNRAIAAKNLRVERECASPVTVEGFPAQLRQVFSNILGNAIDASNPTGKLRVRISVAPLLGEQTEPGARITIADCGKGISKTNLSKIFEAFFTTKAGRGSGVGLWLSSTIVQEHRGRIRVRSSDRAEGSGTIVSVHLPVRGIL